MSEGMWSVNGCTDLIAFKRLKKIKDLIINKR
jgi:hypothetical protein